MPTIRCEFHRVRAGFATASRHEVGSSVWQVFEGSGSVVLGGTEHKVAKGDLFVVPSWVPWELRADSDFDLFRFNDGPIIDRLGFTRTYIPSKDGN
jgi:gentisate 1,2-dioxygenase